MYSDEIRLEFMVYIEYKSAKNNEAFSIFHRKNFTQLRYARFCMFVKYCMIFQCTIKRGRHVAFTHRGC